LLIDELALYLHLKWQKKLVDFIDKKLPNFQLIATTHSPIAAQQADAGELHYLERKDRKINLNLFTGTPKTLLLHQLITTDLFGLETDESSEIEAKKIQYRKLRDKKSRSAKEKKELEKLKIELADLPVRQRGNLTVPPGHLQLIKKLKKELSEKQQ
jgi:predicted ATP-binding protein involved in virulence